MSMKSPFTRLFAAKTRSAEEDDTIERKTDDAEDNLLNPDDAEDLKDQDGDDEATKKAKAKKRAAKKKASDGDDDSDESDEMESKTKAARARERGRIAAIMASPEAAANPNGALRLAVNTSLSREAVIEALGDIGHIAKQPDGARNTSAARKRLTDVTVPDVGSNDTASPTGARAVAEAIIAAGRRRRGEI